MALKAYPLNDTDYTAEDAQLYTATRTSGVYADNHLNISVTGTDNDVTIKPGMCWMKLAMFQGIAVANTEDITINAGIPDSSLPRIDAVVYAYDVNANAPEIIIKKGETGTIPTPPAVVRDDFRHEIHLYHIRRKPGATAITPGDITDLRMDSNYCGLMADSVTRVDMTAINAQVREFIEDWESQIANVTDGKMVESPEYPGCYYRINKGRVEWLNPPMIVGEEYRLAQREDGKRVYAKIVKFESIKNYSELAVSGVEKIVSISAVVEKLLASGPSRTFFQVPCFSVPPETDIASALKRTQVYFYDGKICVDFALNRGRYDLYVTLSYTRTDDANYTSAYADGDVLYVETNGETTQSGNTLSTQLFATVSANGGDYINSIVINGTKYNLATNLAESGIPSASYPGVVGQFYMDTDTGDIYKCTSAEDGVYVWENANEATKLTARKKSGKYVFKTSIESAGDHVMKVSGETEGVEATDDMVIIRGVNRPVLSNDVANKKYVDDVIGQNALDTFIRNTDIDYAHDETTGAYYTVIRVYRDKLDGTKQYPFVYAPNGANAGDKSTYDMTVTDGWLLAINSGVFDTSTRKPDGIVIQNGVVIQNSPTATHSQNKPLTIDRNGNLGYAAFDADAGELITSGIVSAVCGFMPIIVDYEAVPDTDWNSVAHYTDNAQRQIIGQWGNGDYAIITCEGRNHHNSDGWTIAEAQAICKKHGLKFAYNLDGGGSTETMLGKKHINTIYENATGRKVPTFIVFNGDDTFNVEGTPVESYADLNYIETDGNAYIVTDITEAEEPFDIDYEVSASDVMASHNGGGHIFSSVNTFYPFIACADGNFTSPKQKIRGTEVYEFHDDKFSYNTWYTVQGRIDGTTYSSTVLGEDGSVIETLSSGIGTTFANSNTFALFAYGGAPATERFRFCGKLKYLKLSRSGAVEHHFVPVKEDATGTIGLLDKITGTFYSSATATAFTGA